MTAPARQGGDSPADDWRSTFLRILNNDAYHARSVAAPPSQPGYRPSSGQPNPAYAQPSSGYGQPSSGYGQPTSSPPPFSGSPSSGPPISPDQWQYPSQQPAPVPSRDHGFVVIATGTASLQHVQELCVAPFSQAGDRCLTARYDVGDAPLPGSLFAALAVDLAAAQSGDGATTGRFLPETGSPGRWDLLCREVTGAARFDFASQRTGVDLRGDWLDRFLDVLGNDRTLAGGTRLASSPPARLVLFAETADATWLTDEAEETLRALTARLPEPVGLVISVPGLARQTRIVDPSFAYLAMDEPDLPDRWAADYVEVPLTGDQLAQTDGLGRDGYAGALATLVMLPDTGPMTIGVHAPWGMGKSSFMHFVERHLVEFGLLRQQSNRWLFRDFWRQDGLSPAEQLFLATSTDVGQPPPPIRGPFRRWRQTRIRRRVGRTVIPIWFNAWQYEGAKQIWAGLTHQLTQAMEQSMSPRRRLATRIGYSVRRRGAQFWLGVATPLLVAVLLSALSIKVGLAGGLAALLPKQAALLAKAVPVLVPVFGALYVASRFFKQVKPVSEGLLDYVRQPNYREHMGYQHQVLSDIRYLNGRLRRRQHVPRVVVFIDDLDRCSDEKVLETLQAINLLLTASGCYVFLGIDTDMIIRAIQRHYDFATDPQDKARSYLRKILQINVRLQPPAPVGKLDFLDAFFSAGSRTQLADALDESAELLPEGVGDVPLPWDLAHVGAPLGYAVQFDAVEDTPHELWAFHQLAELVPTNPRELKRLVNVHRLVKIVLKRAGLRPSAPDQRLLVGWLLFCFDQPLRAAVLVARARREADAGGPDVLDQPAQDDQLDRIIERLHGDPTSPEEEQRPRTLTFGQLLPGTQYAEAWEVSSLFRLS